MRVEQLSNVSNGQVPNCIRFRVQGLGIRVQGFIEAKKRTLPKLYMQQGLYRRGPCPDCSQSLARQPKKCRVFCGYINPCLIVANSTYGLWYHQSERRQTG